MMLFEGRPKFQRGPTSCLNTSKREAVKRRGLAVLVQEIRFVVCLHGFVLSLKCDIIVSLVHFSTAYMRIRIPKKYPKKCFWYIARKQEVRRT